MQVLRRLLETGHEEILKRRAGVDLDSLSRRNDPQRRRVEIDGTVRMFILVPLLLSGCSIIFFIECILGLKEHPETDTLG